MTVDAAKDYFGHPEDEENKSLTHVDNHECRPTHYEKGDESDDSNSGSVKNLPMSQEDKLCQIDEIDQEMMTKLKQLHGLMADGKLKQSVKFLEQHFSISKNNVNATHQPQMILTKIEVGSGRQCFTGEIMST